ncbi:MAG: AAA family ATPase [Cryobacterium sp.]|nr:AAA family ATPase [Cryobacterium sp.]MCO5293777.1 AAA family ATPase [Homoserinimonas sp.]MCW5945191.1 AAA family ATPase [Cryobacterium sp.]
MGNSELQREREYVNGLYARLGELIEEAKQRLAEVRSSDVGGGHQARSERDSFAKLFEDRILQLQEVGDRLAFGRITTDENEPEPVHHYIGRIGIRSEDLKPLLLDWRVPQASAFYQATALNPMGTRSRRHLYVRGRELVRIEDEVFDSKLLQSEGIQLQGEGALLAAMSAQRTGRMSDIVATIQAEQDKIIRSEIKGVLVVQGGPGTGKTAVALHRAAFLLYSNRERLRSSGVLIVGPTRSFVRYIEAVLPSLGESGVVLASLGQLYPGIEASEDDPTATARLKGSIEMVKLIEKAVRSRQVIPEAAAEIRVNGESLTLEPELIARALKSAQATGLPHNEARVVFARAALGELTERMAAKLRERGSTLDDSDLALLREDLRTSDDVKVQLNTAWLPLTPQKLLQDLYSRPNWLAELTPDWNPEKRALLRRDRGAEFTISDIPLLDEAAELLGEDAVQDQSRLRQQQEQAERDIENARQAIESFKVEGFIDAKSLAEGFADYSDSVTTAERAASDRTWAYGHVVVDEAQELSAMQWRLLRRRGPSLSFTVVGDIAQAASASAVGDWSTALKSLIGARNQSDWLRLEELTVNYRTPSQIAEQAERMALAHNLPITAAAAVRSSNWPPELVNSAETAVELAFEVGGTIGVMAPKSRLPELFEELQATFPGRVGIGAEGIDSEITVLSTFDAKGLEFDTVVIVDAVQIVDESDRGAASLYVAMTRPTQRLVFVGTNALPDGIDLSRSSGKQSESEMAN